MRNMETKVFGGAGTVNGKRVAMAVAATSQRGAAQALQNAGINVNVRHLADYWQITGNKAACTAALAAPGVVFATSSLDKSDYTALPACPVPAKTGPKVPTDPDELREYDRQRVARSNEAKLARGERRVTTWLSKEAAEALDKLTGNSTERGVVQAALTQALLTCAAQLPAKRTARKAA